MENPIKRLLGTELWREYVYLKGCGDLMSPQGRYFYLLFERGYLPEVFSSENWAIFKISEDERKAFKLKKEYGGLYWLSSSGFPEFYSLDDDNIERIINEETERFKDKDFFEEA